MLSDLLPYLRCPVCHGGLASEHGPGSRPVRCPAGHSFDPARAGYLPLTRGPVRHPGDSAAMVAARESFLGSGAYEFLAGALAAVAAARRGPVAAGGLVVEVGAGTGYYLAKVLDALPAAVGLAVDTAKPALRRAARAHPRAGAVLADVWQQLPVADHTVAFLLSVFAPRNGAEFARVLAPDGLLVVVTPTPAHLLDLTSALGGSGVRLLGIAPEKPNRLAASLARWFRAAGADIHTRRLALSHAQARALVHMGPSAAHVDPADLERALFTLPDPVPTTASVRLSRFELR